MSRKMKSTKPAPVLKNNASKSHLTKWLGLQILCVSLTVGVLVYKTYSASPDEVVMDASALTSNESLDFTPEKLIHEFLLTRDYSLLSSSERESISWDDWLVHTSESQFYRSATLNNLSQLSPFYPVELHLRSFVEYRVKFSNTKNADGALVYDVTTIYPELLSDLGWFEEGFVEKEQELMDIVVQNYSLGLLRGPLLKMNTKKSQIMLNEDGVIWDVRAMVEAKRVEDAEAELTSDILETVSVYIEPAQRALDMMSSSVNARHEEGISILMSLSELPAMLERIESWVDKLYALHGEQYYQFNTTVLNIYGLYYKAFLIQGAHERLMDSLEFTEHRVDVEGDGTVFAKANWFSGSGELRSFVNINLEYYDVDGVLMGIDYLPRAFGGGDASSGDISVAIDPSLAKLVDTVRFAYESLYTPSEMRVLCGVQNMRIECAVF